MHPEKNIGRFGVSTSQTIKRNDYIRIQEKAVSHYEINGEQAAFSLNRHKAWEMLEQAQNVEENDDNSIIQQEKKQTKKKQFQQHLNKSKHDSRLQQKELAKLKKNMEKNKTISNDTESSDEPVILKKAIKGERYPKGVQIPENGILISEVMSRGQIYKLMQHRDRLNSASSKSRHERKEEFNKSIFL